jgi:hypothetical protein
MNLFRLFTGCALVLALSAAQTHAGIITPVSVTPSSEFAPASNLINGSGLNVLGRHDNNENNMWQTFSADPTTDFVEFELDASYDLSEAFIWQYNGKDGNGNLRPDREVDDFEISVSPDLVSPFVSVGTFNLAPAADQSAGPPNGEIAQTFTLVGASSVRRVRIDIDSLHVVPPDPNVISGDLGGLSEVRFFGTRVPEPTSLCMAAVGCLSISLGILRRRRRN